MGSFFIPSCFAFPETPSIFDEEETPMAPKPGAVMGCFRSEDGAFAIILLFSQVPCLRRRISKMNKTAPVRWVDLKPGGDSPSVGESCDGEQHVGG
jgi:hypothetical protein